MLGVKLLWIDNFHVTITSQEKKKLTPENTLVDYEHVRYEFKKKTFQNTHTHIFHSVSQYIFCFV